MKATIITTTSRRIATRAEFDGIFNAMTEAARDKMETIIEVSEIYKFFDEKATIAELDKFVTTRIVVSSITDFSEIEY